MNPRALHTVFIIYMFTCAYGDSSIYKACLLNHEHLLQ